MTIHWTERAQDDLAATRAFIEADSTHYAAVTVRRLLGAVDRLADFPRSGRAVPEFSDHVLTVHHGSRGTLGAV